MREITNREFNKEVLESQIPMFAYFTTRWCHSCYSTCLIANQLAKEYDGRVKFVKVDVEKIPHVSIGYRIIAVPTILIFKDSQLVKALLGFQERSSLKSLLDGVINENEITGTLQLIRGSRALY